VDLRAVEAQVSMTDGFAGLEVWVNETEVIGFDSDGIKFRAPTAVVCAHALQELGIDAELVNTKDRP